MAERLVYKPECGCEVYRIMHSKPNLYRIQYCPKHKSAPDLYEALRLLLRAWESHGGYKDCCCAMLGRGLKPCLACRVKTAKQALAKADGTKGGDR